MLRYFQVTRATNKPNTSRTALTVRLACTLFICHLTRVPMLTRPCTTAQGVRALERWRLSLT